MCLRNDSTLGERNSQGEREREGSNERSEPANSNNTYVYLQKFHISFKNL